MSAKKGCTINTDGNFQTAPYLSNEFTLPKVHTFDLCSNGVFYDRYISLCQRFFKAPIVFITLFDNDQSWFKSLIEFGDHEFPRIKCLSSSLAFPQCPDFFIVEDTLQDDRFSNTLDFVERPQLRFFAGAALIVKEVRIGSLCVIDTEPRRNFTEEDKLSLLDFSTTLSLLISTQRDSARLEEKIAEIKRDEETRFEHNLMVEKNKQMVDLMHQVRTPLMSIKLNASLVEAGQKEASMYLKPDPQCNAITQQLNASISELQTSISNLDKFVTTSLFLDDNDNNSPKNEDGNDRSNIKMERLPSDDAIMTVRPTQCNINNMLKSVQNELVLSGNSMEIELLVDQDLHAISLISYPEVLAFTLRSVLTQASSCWGKASITINFTLYEGRSLCQSQQSNDATSLLEPSTSFYNTLGFLTIMIRILNPIPISTKSNISNVSYKIDIKPIEKLLFDIGGDCRKMAFDSESSSTSCFEHNALLHEMLIEVHIPCDIKTINYDINKEDNEIYDNNNNSNVEIEIDMINISDDEDEEGDDDDDDDDENDDRTISVGMLPASHVKSSMYDFTTGSDSGIEVRAQEFAKTIRNSSSNNNALANPTTTTIGQNKLRVLIVEDSAIIYKVLKRWLETEGCEVTVAENGFIGLTYLQTQQFDVTLMDFIMPVMLGRDAMRQFQEWKEEAPHIHTINNSMILLGMSANASKRDQEEAYDYGMHYFMAKPIDLLFLTAVLEAKRNGGDMLDTVIQDIQMSTGVVLQVGRRNKRWKRSGSLQSLNSIPASNSNNNTSVEPDKASKAKQRLAIINKNSRNSSSQESNFVTAAITENLPIKPKRSHTHATMNMLTRFGESIIAMFSCLSGTSSATRRVSPAVTVMTRTEHATHSRGCGMILTNNR